MSHSCCNTSCSAGLAAFSDFVLARVSRSSTQNSLPRPQKEREAALPSAEDDTFHPHITSRLSEVAPDLGYPTRGDVGEREGIGLERVSQLILHCESLQVHQPDENIEKNDNNWGGKGFDAHPTQ